MNRKIIKARQPHLFVDVLLEIMLLIGLVLYEERDQEKIGHIKIDEKLKTDLTHAVRFTYSSMYLRLLRLMCGRYFVSQ